MLIFLMPWKIACAFHLRAQIQFVIVRTCRRGFMQKSRTKKTFCALRTFLRLVNKFFRAIAQSCKISRVMCTKCTNVWTAMHIKFSMKIEFLGTKSFKIFRHFAAVILICLIKFLHSFNFVILLVSLYFTTRCLVQLNYTYV